MEPSHKPEKRWQGHDSLRPRVTWLAAMRHMRERQRLTTAQLAFILSRRSGVLVKPRDVETWELGAPCPYGIARGAADTLGVADSGAFRERHKADVANGGQRT